MTIELWTSPTPNGWKVTIMLEELKEAGVDLPCVELKPVDLFLDHDAHLAWTKETFADEPGFRPKADYEAERAEHLARRS